MARRDDDRELERLAILRRRAQLISCAVVAGVGLPECTACLSPMHNAGGAATEAPTAGMPSGSAGVGENAGEGGQAFCLTIAESGGAGAAGAPAVAGGEGGGGPRLCLSVR